MEASGRDQPPFPTPDSPPTGRRTTDLSAFSRLWVRSPTASYSEGYRRKPTISCYPQGAQHHSPSGAHRRADQRSLQPPGIHRSGIPRRRQSLR
ncbi:hypothetical protein Trydic_g12954 [Trypoxylus dichotomus]